MASQVDLTEPLCIIYYKCLDKIKMNCSAAELRVARRLEVEFHCL